MAEIRVFFARIVSPRFGSKTLVGWRFSIIFANETPWEHHYIWHRETTWLDDD